MYKLLVKLLKLFDHFVSMYYKLLRSDWSKDTVKILRNGLPTAKALVFEKLIIKHKHETDKPTVYMIHFIFPYDRHILLISGYIRIIQYQ